MKPWTNSSGVEPVRDEGSANLLVLTPEDLSETERFILENPAKHPVDPRVHNELIEALLARLVDARRGRS